MKTFVFGDVSQLRGRFSKKPSFISMKKPGFPALPRQAPKISLQLITKAKSGVLPLDSRVLDSLNNIREISIIPPERSSVTHKVKAGVELKFEVRAPARIKMVLNQVDQELFENLSSVLGEGYFSSFPSEKYLEVEGPKEDSQKERGRKDTAEIARAILPATEHNPVLLFHLRPNVKFHDGHVLEAEDVKFTYEAILNPKNISPRLSDYEPVKRVEVIIPLTLRSFTSGCIRRPSAPGPWVSRPSIC